MTVGAIQTRFGVFFHRRVALGVAPHAAPSLLFVLIGIALGPQSLGLISVNVLAQLDPVISVALAVLGIYIGAGALAVRDRRMIAWLGGATAQALIAFAAVGGAMYVLLVRWQLPLPLPPAAAAAVLGLCSAASAAVGLDRAASDRARAATHLADLDDLPLVVLGTILVPQLAGRTAIGTAIALALAAGVMVGIAGALLFAGAKNAPERGVFVAGTVTLLAGAAAYAGASPLSTGCVAGLVWALWPGSSTTSLVDSDLRRLQHPLVALLLLIAGASIQFTFALLWVVGPLVLFRLTGKLLGSMAVARALGASPAVVAAILAPPGVFGIALALNIQQVLTTGDALLVSAIAVSTVIAEGLALLLLPGDELA